MEVSVPENITHSHTVYGPAGNSPKYLIRSQAAEYVRATWGMPCSRAWLAKLAVVGGGPMFRKAGKTPLYAPDDLDTWAKARIGAPRASTSVQA